MYISADQIPPEVAHEVFRRFEMDTEREAAEAIAAALNAWPGMHFIGNIGVHLPLPTGDGQ